MTRSLLALSALPTLGCDAPVAVPLVCIVLILAALVAIFRRAMRQG